MAGPRPRSGGGAAPPAAGAVANPSAPKRQCVMTDGVGYFCSADADERRRRARKTSSYYQKRYGVKQTIDGSGEENRKMIEVARNMDQYLSKWLVTNKEESLREKCQNKHDKCVFWASIGECRKNPTYMINDCMLACQACDTLKDGISVKKKEL